MPEKKVEVKEELLADETNENSKEDDNAETPTVNEEVKNVQDAE